MTDLLKLSDHCIKMCEEALLVPRLVSWKGGGCEGEVKDEPLQARKQQQLILRYIAAVQVQGKQLTSAGLIGTIKPEKSPNHAIYITMTKLLSGHRRKEIQDPCMSWIKSNLS
jgi:hypothetical protein